MKKVILILTLALALAFAYQGEKEIEVKVKGEKDTGVGLVIKSLDKTNMEKLDVKSGALVLAALEESSAKKAGLMKNDVIIEANGKKIDDAEQLNDLAEALKKGEKLKLTALRDGKKKTFTTTVEDLKSDAYAFSWTDDGDDEAFAVAGINEDIDGDDVHVNVVASGDDDGPHSFAWKSKGDLKGGYLGVELDNINDQMKEYFEVKSGALIKKVVEDSPAEKAGLKAGDVITKIGDKKIEDTGDVVRTVNYYDPDDEVEIEFVRKGDDESVDVVLGKKKFMSGKNAFFFDEDSPKNLKHLKEKTFNITKELPKGMDKVIRVRKELKLYII